MKVLDPMSGFPVWGSNKGTGNPQGNYLEGQWVWLQYFHRTGGGGGGNKNTNFGGRKQNLSHTKTQKKGIVTPQKILLKLPASVGGSPVGHQGLTTGTGTLAAAVWEGLPWHKPSWRLPLAWPYWGLSFGTMWHLVHADWSQVSSGPTGVLACGMLGGESLLPAWASRQPEGESTPEAESPQDPLGFQLWDCGTSSSHWQEPGLLRTWQEVMPLKKKVIRRTQDVVTTNRVFPQCFFINMDSYGGDGHHNFPWTWSGVCVKYVSWNWLLELLLCIGFFINDHT